jgi:hypothetical protein
MSLMTSPARPRTARRAATLTLTIDGIAYDARAFDFDGDGQSVNGVEHSLRGPTGDRFQIYGCSDGTPGGPQNYCERCRRDGCRHILALSDVGLI